MPEIGAGIEKFDTDTDSDPDGWFSRFEGQAKATPSRRSRLVLLPAAPGAGIGSQKTGIIRLIDVESCPLEQAFHDPVKCTVLIPDVRFIMEHPLHYKKENFMPAYVLARVEVTDPEQFKKYLEENPKTITLYGGKYLTRGGEVVTFEGEAETRRIVLIEFPSLEKAKEWYHSAEYQKVKLLREGAAIGSIIAMEGC